MREFPSIHKLQCSRPHFVSDDCALNLLESVGNQKRNK